jgi:hypothetical protein
MKNIVAQIQLETWGEEEGKKTTLLKRTINGRLSGKRRK